MASGYFKKIDIFFTFYDSYVTIQLEYFIKAYSFNMHKKGQKILVAEGSSKY